MSRSKIELSRFARQQEKIERKLNSLRPPLWGFALPTISRVTGRSAGDIYCFGDNYEYVGIGVGGVEHKEEDYDIFLDKVRTLEDLIQGLQELSPFADDALAIAETMDEEEFVEFKLALAYERRAMVNGVGESKLSDRYVSLVLPVCLLKAMPVAQKFNVSIGVAMLRLVEADIDIFPTTTAIS